MEKAPQPRNKISASTATTPTFSAEHQDYLRARGVDESVAVAAGARSVTPEQVRDFLGWDRTPQSGGLYIPHLDRAGEAVAHRVRLDDPQSGNRWFGSRGRVHPWLPTPLVLARCGFPPDALEQPDLPLVIVEGPFKALSLLSNGILAISLAGVCAGGHDKERRDEGRLDIHEDLRERVVFKGRTCSISFDANLAWNHNVADAMAMNAEALTSSGANVGFVRIPPTKAGDDQGPDDFLAEHGAEALEELIHASLPAQPVAVFREAFRGDVDEAERKESARELLKDKPFLALFTRSDPVTREEVRSVFRTETGLRLQVLDAAVKEYEKAPRRRSVAAAAPSTDGYQRPQVVVGADLHRTAARALDALRAQGGVYVFMGCLAVVVESEGDVPRLHPLKPDALRVEMSEAAMFFRQGDEKSRRTSPPLDVAKALLERGDYDGLPHVRAIATTPVLLANGDVLEAPGFYEEHGVLVAKSAASYPQIAIHTKAITNARCAILDLVSDFPFAEDQDRAAWLAALLTCVGRSAIAGPVPAFLVEASVRGSGKGLLVKTIEGIASGRDLPMTPLPTSRWRRHCWVDDAELRKKLLAHFLAQDRMIAIDNIRCTLDSAVLEAYLTAEVWTDRILGKSQNVTAPATAVVFLIANNPCIAGDLHRRVVRIRLRSPDMRPELHGAFKWPRLLRHVRDQHRVYCAHALTLLRAFIIGRRQKRIELPTLTEFGSYEGWSDVVRGCVVWLGLPDPLAVPDDDELRDPQEQLVRSFHESWAKIFGDRPGSARPFFDLRGRLDADEIDALLELCGLDSHVELSARKVADILRSQSDRVIDGRRLSPLPSGPAQKRSRAGQLWAFRSRGGGHGRESQ